MGIKQISEMLSMFSAIVSTIKKIKDLMPSGNKKEELEGLLKETQEKIKNAEAGLAKELGYDLCYRHLPPGIMLEIDDYKKKCNICGHEENYLD